MILVETFARLFFGFLAQVVPFGVLAIYPFWNNLRVSKRRATALIVITVPLIGILFAGTGCYLQTLLPPDDTLFNAVNVVFLLCLIPCLVLYLVLVQATWQEQLFIFSFALTCAWGITAITSVISSLNHLTGLADGLPYKGWLPLLIVALGILCTPPLILLLKTRYLPVRNGISWKQSTVLALLSTAMFIMLAIIYTISSFTDVLHPLTLVLLIVVLGMVYGVYAAILALLKVGSERLNAQREADQAEHMLQLQSQQISALDRAQRRDRRMRHDMRHALATIRGLTTQGDYVSAIKLIDEYVEGFASSDFTHYCENEAVNSIVSYYAMQAKENAIRLQVQINLGESMTSSTGELCVVLGNLLDNAITAAVQADGNNRWVRLGVAALGDTVAITVDNGFSGTVKMDGSRYLSTKSQHTGLGLESVIYVAKKYHGAAEFIHEGNEFHASVMLSDRP